ncbi:hypothetical protein EV138_0130 [Kribbella voronezhensis]|uniref:Uncharacterized protein n=1 Tax=Kribbella voronezhensis TaxID=2512212 RepID=A0A4R7T6C6_9ACTN|nr:hypothetical protein [Kribbella voronezhensis]TDU86617.1 hypothetical protein EV138_0130 [Kribbella voronezhensis]
MNRWVRRTCGLVFAVLISVAGVAVPASAGGPTSVLLSAPPKVVAVGYDDARYGQLQRLTEVELTGPKEAGDHAQGRFIRALWMIHDMSAWRFDLIYPNAPGGPWIATYENPNGGPSLPAEPVWHRSSDSVALTKVLVSLGLMNGQFYGGPTGPPNTAEPAALPEPTPVATPLPAPAAQTIETHQRALSGWRWAIPGIVLGGLVTYVALRRIPRRRPWELTDVE